MRKHIAKLGAAAILLALPMATFAQQTFSYRYVDVGLFPKAEVDYGNADEDGEGIQLRGSLPVTDNVHVLTEFQILNLDRNIDTTRLMIGGGFNWPINNKLDIIGRAGVVNYQVDVGPFDDDDTGVFIGARLRAIVAPNLEVEGGFEHQRVEVFQVENDTYLVAEARYNFTRDLSAGVVLNVGGDVSVFGVQARLAF
jgi:hypothetical protein